MSDESRGRTKTEVSNDLAYEIRLHERHARLYRRIRAVLAFIALCGGASAFANILTEPAWLRGVGGVLVAACAFIDVVFDFSAKAVAHDAYRRKALALQVREPRLSLETFDAALSELSFDDPGCIEALRRPAFNDMLRTRGYDGHVQTLGMREKLISFFA